MTDRARVPVRRGIRTASVQLHTHRAGHIPSGHPFTPLTD